MIFSLLFFSCKEKAIVNNREKVEYKYELIGRKNICFKLDSITSHIFTASEYNDKTRSYAFFGAWLCYAPFLMRAKKVQIHLTEVTI